MRPILFILSLCLILAGPVSAAADGTGVSTLTDAQPGNQAHAERQVVPVGGYEFPPFVDSNANGGWTGVTLELIALLNDAQDEYLFEFLPTSATRRYLDFANGRFDLMFFESPHWGWQGQPVVGLRGPAVGGEVFIAAARPGRGQEYFADRSGKRIAVFSGYHYAFAGYNSDKDYLRQEHNAIITFSQESSMQMVLRDRVDLAVIPQAFLERYLSEYPQYRSGVLVATEPDQYFQHILIKRDSSKPRLSVLAGLLKRLQDEGALQGLLARHGLLVSKEQ